MRRGMFFAVLLSAAVAASAGAQVVVPDGFESAALDQNFGGGFDYLPNGDIIGMYVDSTMGDNAYIGVIDANGDGDPAAVTKVYDFGAPLFGSFVKVSPDGTFALFAESSTFKVYSLKLSNNSVTEITPDTGSFDGVYDCAFIDSAWCYISANPAFGTTNKVFRLDLSTRALTEVISVDGTYSAPLDIDDGGNLYYVKNAGVFPLPDTGAFTLLRFDSSDLDAVLAGAPVLGKTDAEQLAVLDGGFDVVWHSSGAIYVSDNNNGRIYTIAPVSSFVTLANGIEGGFSVLAFYKREQAFGPNSLTDAKLAVAYADAFGGSTPANMYQVTSIAPKLGVGVNKFAYTAGDMLSVDVLLRRDVPVAFDAYVVFVGPSGTLHSYTPKGVESGITAYLGDVPGLFQPYSGAVATLTVPQGAPTGDWKVYAAILKAGAEAKLSNALASDSAGFTVE